VAAFRHVETAALSEARSALDSLSANISAWVVSEKQGELRALTEGQRAKLA
jgi:hypothetical protein